MMSLVHIRKERALLAITGAADAVLSVPFKFDKGPEFPVEMSDVRHK